MTTFKAGWRIIAAHKLYMTFYVVWLCVMMVMMSFAVVSGSVRDDDKTVVHHGQGIGRRGEP